MSRPLAFPSRGGRLLLLLFAVTLGPFLLAVLAGGWLVLTLSPLQKFYLPAYTASSLGAGMPHNLTPLRWVEKTAPGRKPEPMTPEDAASGGTGTLPSRSRRKLWPRVGEGLNWGQRNGYDLPNLHRIFGRTSTKRRAFYG